ncbi:DUF305 domain-containing protein [Microbacterium maritypicum]
MDQAKPPRVGRVTFIVAALVMAMLIGVIAYSAGGSIILDAPEPADASAEAGFARDMQVHHNQGVEIAMIVRDRTEDPSVRLLAYDIAITQAQQSGQLYGWLTEWGLSQVGSEPSMAWMRRSDSSDHGHSAVVANTPGESMPGLATPAQIDELAALSGVEAERLFLRLMIAHHTGAIEMARAVLDRADNTSVVAFATAVLKGQTAEMDLMTGMLAERS